MKIFKYLVKSSALVLFISGIAFSGPFDDPIKQIKKQTIILHCAVFVDYIGSTDGSHIHKSISFMKSASKINSGMMRDYRTNITRDKLKYEATFKEENSTKEVIRNLYQIYDCDSYL